MDGTSLATFWRKMVAEGKNLHDWKDSAKCLGLDTELFFDQYEENKDIRQVVEGICMSCPVMKECFAVGVSQKGWGVWGGIYLENGEISKEFSDHRDKDSWAKTWQKLTMD
jgi:hypothetical protein